MISSFTGEYGFLSNFSRHPVVMYGVEWRTVEHAFQAAKFWPGNTEQKREHLDRIWNAPAPAGAKSLGASRVVPIDPLWDVKREGVMLTLVTRKFADPALARQLRATAPHVLVEGNGHGDRDWGAIWVKTGQGILDVLKEFPGAMVWDQRGDGGPWLVGRNMLGKVLMRVRDELAA